jgi:hypothetical protein
VALVAKVVTISFATLGVWSCLACSCGAAIRGVPFCMRPMCARSNHVKGCVSSCIHIEQAKTRLLHLAQRSSWSCMPSPGNAGLYASSHVTHVIVRLYFRKQQTNRIKMDCRLDDMDVRFLQTVDLC